MKRLPRFLHSRRFHLIMTIVWAVLLVPTVLWWKNSILWIALMSDYALMAAHWASYQGARAEREARDGNGTGSEEEQ